jgi:hypothetical protein
MKKTQKAHAQAQQENFHHHHHAMWKEKYVVLWSEEDSEVPDRVAVRSASDLDAKRAPAEMSSAEERSAAAAAHAHVLAHAYYYSRVYSHAVIQVRAAGGFAGAGDRGDEVQGTTTREFAGVTRIQMRRRVRRAMVAMVATRMRMSAGTEVFHCCCCCSSQECGGRRQSGGGEASASGIDSAREAKRHLLPGPVGARGERGD